MTLPYSISSDHTRDYVKSGATVLIRLGELLDELARTRGEFGLGPARKETEILPEIEKAENAVAAFFGAAKRAALRQYVSGLGVDGRGKLNLRACRIVAVLIFQIVRHGNRGLNVMTLARMCAASGSCEEILEYRRVIAYLGTTAAIAVVGDAGFNATIGLGTRLMISLFGGTKAIPHLNTPYLEALREDRRCRHEHVGRRTRRSRLQSSLLRRRNRES